MKSVIGGAAIAALLTIPVAIWTWWINARGNVLALPILAFDFWLSFFMLVLPAVALVHLAGRLLKREPRLRHDAAIGAAILFFLLWFVRMEPAHQMVSFTPHFTLAGAIDLLGIVVATGLVFAIGIAPSARRVVLYVIAIALMCVVLEALARAQAPPRHRDEAVARVQRFLAPSDAQTGMSAPHRVLLIGLDGMDWRVVASLVEAGKLPAIAKLLREGRYYQLDNHDMRLSPEIWTVIYTGVEGRRSGIDGFVQWNFAGVREPVVELPKFGCHTILYLERVLWYSRFRILWHARPVSNRDFTAPPIWTIASHAGRRVAVVEPMPIESWPERISAFIVGRRWRMTAFYEGRRVGLPVRGIRRDTEARMVIQEERSRLAAAAPLLAAGRYDAAIYYTHFLDGIGHFDWEHVRSLDAAALERTTIGEGYVQADRSVAAVIEAFGQPATVILVSDHGWEFNDYEHFLSPYGVLAISPASQRGYGGKASVRTIAPTFLALAGVAPGANMDGPLPDAPPPLPAVDHSALLDRPFYPRVTTEEEIMKRLRALGYIGR